MISYGTFNPDGTIHRQSVRCALTDTVVSAHDSVMIKIAGTTLYYRVALTAYRRLTADKRQDIEVAIRTEHAIGTWPDEVAPPTLPPVDEWSDPAVEARKATRQKSKAPNANYT
jgi:hypothetical protein